MNRIHFFLYIIVILSGCGNMLAQGDLPYQLPPRPLQDIVDAPVPPDVLIDPTNRFILFMVRQSLPSIADIAGEELRLGGLRIDPATNGPSRGTCYTSLYVTDINGNDRKEAAGLPEHPKITNVSWSHDGSHVAFTLVAERGISLWMMAIPDMVARKLTEDVVNNAFPGRPYVWMPDNMSVLVREILPGRGECPRKPAVPDGPVIQETGGRAAAVRTYQDLLADRYDEAMFEYCTTSHLVRIDKEGNRQETGMEGIIMGFDPSPDGSYLLVERLEKPFSYQVPYYLFPKSAEIWDMQGTLIRRLASLPLGDDIPRGFDAVRRGPRNFQWRADVGATICWLEALDQGDPSLPADERDQLWYLPAPFTADPVKGITFQLRAGRITWGNGQLAVATERWEKTRKERVWFFVPEGDNSRKKLVFDLSSEDRYADPGDFITRYTAGGQQVLLTGNKGKEVYLSGMGASPEGNRPFIDRYEIPTGKISRLWRSEAPWYETLVAVVDISRGAVITSRQSAQVPPNYFMRNLKNGRLTAITHFEHPYPRFRDIKKELVTYEREDGVGLSFELYLPPGYKKEDGPLPTLLWAYPREYKSAGAAGQVQTSPYTFTRISPSSAVIFTLMGYAVLDNTAFPVIGEGDNEPNDTYIEQLVANAAAAIRKATEIGVTDPRRVAVGGHSYGAFMTANLLAHCDLFAAGIARSGAYNRTLTPFGFQAEPRTYWEAPDTYNRMSPFMYSDKIKTPILLIHGLADNNSGTFPIQSERFYQAVKGHGGTARLVMLPHESHGYAARESILHMLWEMNEWLNKYVMNR